LIFALTSLALLLYRNNDASLLLPFLPCFVVVFVPLLCSLIVSQLLPPPLPGLSMDPPLPPPLVALPLRSYW
jgi:hypothetical protein